MKQTTVYFEDDVRKSMNEKLPRTVSVSAYVNSIMKVFVWDEKRLQKEYSSNPDFREVIDKVLVIVKKFIK